MATMYVVEVETEVDLCPVCGASGMEWCAEEDGQTVLDHWGRPATLPTTAEEPTGEPGVAA
jgi:hypothetical protein